MNLNSQEIIKIYLDFVNNFLTLDAFCDHYALENSEAIQLLKKGKALNETDCLNRIQIIHIH